MQCNVHQLPAAEEPYLNERFCPEDMETEDSDSTESDSLAVRAYQLSLQGLSQREIAKALEISQSSVYRALKKAELS
ncbi:helix-turn-helix domain-containing protein [Endozoicomonas numazuensis]|uniref:Uncharacterized protein n=2 Tax=Endozoicomonas numazuensis TaxID=1137799 RepID=A0A081MZA9_9GAMM|nr:hypothetical protein GZ78_28950 [Endozoicomonas numazuensis]